MSTKGLGDQQRGLKSFEGYSNFEHTVSDFKKAYDQGVRGLTDIDAAYEKNGYIAWFEGKWIVNDNFDVPISQVQILNSFNQKRGCKSFLVAHRRTPDGVRYWLSGIENFVHHARKGRPDKTVVLRVNVSVMSGPHTQEQFWKAVKAILDPLETYSNIDKNSILLHYDFPEFI